MCSSTPWVDGHQYYACGEAEAKDVTIARDVQRKLAFNAHPDVDDNPDAQRFRKVYEAYAALDEMAQSCPRRIKVLQAPDRRTWSRAEVLSGFGGEVRSRSPGASQL